MPAFSAYLIPIPLPAIEELPVTLEAALCIYRTLIPILPHRPHPPSPPSPPLPCSSSGGIIRGASSAAFFTAAAASASIPPSLLARSGSASSSSASASEVASLVAKPLAQKGKTVEKYVAKLRPPVLVGDKGASGKAVMRVVRYSAKAYKSFFFVKVGYPANSGALCGEVKKVM
ncbi:unnamed protein product [Closterium sp. Naga37s-1]|nr:unnamed protein product [Closterium sp. Naga37s-1]